MDKKKTGIIIGVVVLIGLLIVSCLIPPKGKTEELSNDGEVIYANAVSESNSITNEERKPYSSITIDDYLEKYRGTKESIILIGRDTCQYCMIAEPILQKLANDYDLEIYYLNTDYFSEDDINTLANSNEYFNNGFGTPLLMIVKDETIVDTVDGLVDTAHYKLFLRNNGMIQ